MRSRLRDRVHEIIFEADTPAGAAFDIALFVLISGSVAAVMLESVPEFAEQYGTALIAAEWLFTGLFTIEYVLRLWCVDRPLAYARSFFGVIDLLALLPTFVSLVLPGAQSLAVVRVLRILRVFRVLKLARYLGEARVLQTALASSLPKIIVFLVTVILLVVVAGALMYFVEGPTNEAFDTIPRSVYWAVVTVTTVGYGDISPQSALGQFFAVILMITGYAIIAVPTGIVTSELVHRPQGVSTQSCPQCVAEGHRPGAVYCWRCGAELNPQAPPS